MEYLYVEFLYIFDIFVDPGYWKYIVACNRGLSGTI